MKKTGFGLPDYLNDYERLHGCFDSDGGEGGGGGGVDGDLGEFGGVGPDISGVADISGYGGDSSVAAGGGRGYLGTTPAAQEAAALGLGSSATGLGITADPGTAEAAGQEAGGHDTFSGRVAGTFQDMRNNPARSLALSALPGGTLLNTAISYGNVYGSTDTTPAEAAEPGEGYAEARAPSYQSYLSAPYQKESRAPQATAPQTWAAWGAANKS